MTGTKSAGERGVDELHPIPIGTHCFWQCLDAEKTFDLGEDAGLLLHFTQCTVGRLFAGLKTAGDESPQVIIRAADQQYLVGIVENDGCNPGQE